MSEKRRGLGRGIGALIPPAPDSSGVPTTGRKRPVDVFFPAGPGGRPAPPAPAAQDLAAPDPAAPVSRGTVVEDDRVTEADDVDIATADRAAEPAEDRVAASADTASPVEGAPADGSEAHSVSRGTDGRGAPNVTIEGRTSAPAARQEADPGDHGTALPDPTSDEWATAGGLLPVPGAQFAELPIGSIRANARQPRQVFEQDAMSELVHSVREIGVLQPVVVRPLDEPDADGAQFELIMGERRWRASTEAGLTTVPAIIRATDDDVMLRDALLENLHRAELNPLEEAAAYQQLLEDFGCTQDELSRRIGRSRPQISNTIRLLRLPPAVQRRVAAGVISAGHARALLALEDEGAADKLAHRIVTEGLSVRAIEEIVASQGPRATAKAAAPRPGRHLPLLDVVASRLSDRLDTRVKVALGKNRGRLTVEFASVDDLDRILSVLDPGGPGVTQSASDYDAGPLSGAAEVPDPAWAVEPGATVSTQRDA